MNNQYGLSGSLENYLRIIYELESKQRVSRVKDISEKLHVKNPSVCGTLRILKDKGMVNYTPHRVITLTEQGRQAGRALHGKYSMLYEFLKTLPGVDREAAARAACGMEHTLSPSIRRGLEALTEILREDSRLNEQLHGRVRD